MAEPKIQSPNMATAIGMGTLSSNTDLALAEVDIGTITAKAIEDKENQRQRMYETTQDSLKTVKTIKKAQKLEDKIKKGYKLYQEKTGHQLKYDKITPMDVLDDPSLWNQVGDVIITDTVTGATFEPGNFAGFADIQTTEDFKAFANSIDKGDKSYVKPTEYGVEYKDEGFDSEFSIKRAQNPVVNEQLARVKYRDIGLKNWAGGSEVYVMQMHANRVGGVYDEKNKIIKFKDSDETLSIEDFKTGGKVSFDDIKKDLATWESKGDPNFIGYNTEEKGVEKDSLYYGTRDVGLYGINEKDLRVDTWTYTDPDSGFTKEIKTHEISSIQNPDGTYSKDKQYAEIQGIIGSSRVLTQKDDVYQGGGMARFLGKQLKNFFKRKKYDDDKNYTSSAQHSIDLYKNQGTE